MLSHICKTCQFTICTYCLKFYHEKHEVTTIEEFPQHFKEPTQTKLKFLSETINNLTKLTTSSNEKLNQIIDGIIFELQNLKKINAEKNLEFIKENEIIQSFLISVQQEVTQKDLHPNKKLHISNLINSIKLPTEKQSISEEFNIDEERFSELLKIKQNVQNLKEIKFKISVNDNNKETHFNSNLIKNPPERNP